MRAPHKRLPFILLRRYSKHLCPSLVSTLSLNCLLGTVLVGWRYNERTLRLPRIESLKEHRSSMAGAGTKRKRKSKSQSSKGAPADETSARGSFQRKPLILAAVFGAIAGLSAPGIGQWYLAWFGLAPLLLLIVSSPNIAASALRAGIFGLTFNMIYLCWYLSLHPLNWMGFADWQSIPVVIFCWLFVTCQQALIYAAFGAVVRLLPMCGDFLPRKVENKWCIPAFFAIPFLWCLIQEKIGNAPDLLGVPWSMIEYTQYKQIALIQSGSIFGGIGIGALILLSNVAVACLIATFNKKLSCKPLAAAQRSTAIALACVPIVLIAASVAYGFSRLAAGLPIPDQRISLIQGNINIEMQKTNHRYTLDELVHHFHGLMATLPPGFCVMTESAIPAYLKTSPRLLNYFTQRSKEKKFNMIVGAIDRQDTSSYNSAFGITDKGALLSDVYHKRFLVPVGEYKPAFLNYLPEWLQRLTDTPAGTGFTAGYKPTVLNFNGKTVAPLICFETIAPNLVASSVRNGGELLVNISDLAWFHESIIGDQAAAMAVFRAVESDRYFVYAANTGPSMIIDPFGRITARTDSQRAQVLTGSVGLRTNRSPFVQWFN